MPQYTLKFSDPSKTTAVIVPEMPPGINAVDTSLSLVGKGYPNYGLKIAENFLHLLENFAGPLPPENPIEGQLWYDTSDPYRKVLRIMDGTATSTRWPVANGIYQQSTDPRQSASAGLKNGDIWVDTSSNSLKIYNSDGWVIVGPSVSTGADKTTIEPAIIVDTAGISRSVLLNYVGGEVVAVISNSTTSFVPRQVISGFSSIGPGINLVKATNFRYRGGAAESALSLEINNNLYGGETFLRKDDTGIGQTITGKVVFKQPATDLTAKNNYGIVITDAIDSNVIQFYKESLAGVSAIISNDAPGGQIIFRTRTTGTTVIPNTVSIKNGSVAINTSTTAISPALDVFGDVKISSTLTVHSTQPIALQVGGGIQVGGNIAANANATVRGTVGIMSTLTVGVSTGSGAIIVPARPDRYDLGTAANPFRNIYVSGILASTGTVIYGSITGSASRLATAAVFKLQGQVTATSFSFSGVETSVTFNTRLTRSAILDQTTATNVTDTMTIIAVDTSTSALVTSPQKISRKDFLQGVSFPGMITAYAGTVAPAGWLLCNGVSYATTLYPALFAVIGYTYGGSSGSFSVPTYTSLDTNGNTIRHIIKT